MPTVAVILATSLGKRLNSNLPGVLHPILGDPALLWVLRALPREVTAAIIMVHHGGDRIHAEVAHWEQQHLLPCPVSVMDQGESTGTAHALQKAAAALGRLESTNLLILPGNLPLLKPATVARLMASEGAVQLAGGSICYIPGNALEPVLASLRNDDLQLTDAVLDCDPVELASFESREDLATLQLLAQDRINRDWMEKDVSFLNPKSALIGPRVVLSRDAFVEPNVLMEGFVTVGEGTRIGQGCVIRNSVIGPRVEVKPYCVIQQSQVGAGVKLGPFAHLREGSILGEGVHVGNFVETKKARLHGGAKANHLSYLGDIEVGERTNIGAGFISCNYDGFNKNQTLIGKDVFVGSDCQLVAPVALGDGAIIGAGSTITQDVPADALALTRAPLVLKEGAANRLREKQRTKRNQS